MPVYGFGENDSFVRYSFLKSLRLFLSRRLGITVQLWRGRWWTLIPFNKPIDVVLGPVIKVPGYCSLLYSSDCVKVDRQENPSDEQVQALLDRYIRELQALYDANKDLYGYADRKLTIL